MYRLWNNGKSSNFAIDEVQLRREQAKGVITGMLVKLAIKGENPEIAQKTIEQISRITEKQREILKTTFKAMEEDQIKVGLKILVKFVAQNWENNFHPPRLFSEYPRYKLIWPQFRAIPDSSLMHAIELRRHASVYMAGLHSIIHSMDKGDLLAEQLNRIARAHIKWNIHRSHIVHMLEPVLEVVKECNGYKLDSETKEAWTTLYDVIANLIEIYRHKPQPDCNK